MKQLLLYVLLSITVVAGSSQAKFDSSLVIKKMNAVLQEKQKKMPAVLKRKDKVTIENRLDFSAAGFDFKKAGDAEYLQSKTKKVMVLKFADIKQAGNDIYIQTANARYPLSNMEVHADASGKMVKDLPYDEINAAVLLLQSSALITPKQVVAIFNANHKSVGGYTYMNVLIDLTSNIIKWQVRGAPDLQKQEQEVLEIDAISGQVLVQQIKKMNVASAFISQ